MKTEIKTLLVMTVAFALLVLAFIAVSGCSSSKSGGKLTTVGMISAKCCHAELQQHLETAERRLKMKYKGGPIKTYFIAGTVDMPGGYKGFPGKYEVDGQMVQGVYGGHNYLGAVTIATTDGWIPPALAEHEYARQVLESNGIKTRAQQDPIMKRAGFHIP